MKDASWNLSRMTLPFQNLFPKKKIHLEWRVSESASQANLQPLVVGARFSNFKRPEIIEARKRTYWKSCGHPQISTAWDFCWWWCDFQRLPHCASYQEREGCALPDHHRYSVFFCNIFYLQEGKFLILSHKKPKSSIFIEHSSSAHP